MKLHISWLGLVLQNFYYFVIIDAKYHLSQTVWSVTIADAVQSQAGTQSLQKPPGKLLPPTGSLLHGADARQVIATMNKNKWLGLISTTRKVNGNFANKKWKKKKKKKMQLFSPEIKHALQENFLFHSKYGCWYSAFSPWLLFSAWRCRGFLQPQQHRAEI